MLSKDEEHQAYITALASCSNPNRASGPPVTVDVGDKVPYIAPQYIRISDAGIALDADKKDTGVQLRIALLSMLFTGGGPTKGVDADEIRARVYNLARKYHDLQDESLRATAFKFERENNVKLKVDLRNTIHGMIKDELRTKFDRVSGMSGDSYLEALNNLDKIASKYISETYGRPDTIVYPTRLAAIQRNPKPDQDTKEEQVTEKDDLGAPTAASRLYSSVKRSCRYTARLNRLKRRLG